MRDCFASLAMTPIFLPLQAKVSGGKHVFRRNGDARSSGKNSLKGMGIFDPEKQDLTNRNLQLVLLFGDDNDAGISYWNCEILDRGGAYEKYGANRGPRPVFRWVEGHGER